jgi:hypothetical protein
MIAENGSVTIIPTTNERMALFYTNVYSKQLADCYYLRTPNAYGPTTNPLSVAATAASSDDSNDGGDPNHRHHGYGCVSPIRCTNGIVSSLVAITKYLCWQDDDEHHDLYHMTRIIIIIIGGG